MKKSQFLRSSKNPSLNTKSVDSNPEDVDFDEQFCKLEFQGFTDWQKQAQGWPTCVLLQDCETGMLLQDCATERLLKDCHSDICTAANILDSQASLSCFEILSSRESSNSQILYGVTSSGGSSQGQQEALRRQPQHKSQSRKFVSTDARETRVGGTESPPGPQDEPPWSEKGISRVPTKQIPPEEETGFFRKPLQREN